MTSPRDGFRERVGDWADYLPEVHQVRTWDWRLVNVDTLDSISRRLVLEWRERAVRSGLPLHDAPKDPFELEKRNDGGTPR